MKSLIEYMRVFHEKDNTTRAKYCSRIYEQFWVGEAFDRMGWTPIVSLVNQVYIKLVRYFYSKAHFIHGVFIDYTLRGKIYILICIKYVRDPYGQGENSRKLLCLL